jgi:CUB domain
MNSDHVWLFTHYCLFSSASQFFHFIIALFVFGSLRRKSKFEGKSMEICLVLLVLIIQLKFSFADDYHDEPGFWEGYWQNWKLNHKYNKWGKFLSFENLSSQADKSFSDPYRMCGNSTYRNNTMLINPKYPQSYVGGSRCSYRIYRDNHKICQLRIDFLVFSLAQPTGDGICTDDYFTVENGNTTVPRLCGENKGHHVYVTFNKNFPVSIIIATTFQKTFNRRWQLRASQIKCKSHYIGKTCKKQNFKIKS